MDQVGAFGMNPYTTSMSIAVEFVAVILVLTFALTLVVIGNTKKEF